MKSSDPHDAHDPLLSAMSASPNGGAVMQPAGFSGLPTTHSRMLVTGAFFAAIGGLLGLIGAMLGGVAITKTLREWAASENSQLLVAKARAAATAAAMHGATAWKADVPQQSTRGSKTLTGA